MKKQQLRKDNDFNFSVLTASEDEDIETQLGRLVATFVQKYQPTTTLQKEYEDKKLEPYLTMTPDQAMIKYQMMLKTRVVKQSVNDWFPRTIRDHDIEFGMSSVKVAGEQIVPTGGSLEKLDGVSVMAREVANILTMYTSHSKDVVVDISSAPVYNMVKMPPLVLAKYRSLIDVTGGDNLETRDIIYRKLIDKGTKTRCVLLYLISSIYARLPDIATDDTKLTEFYNKHRSEYKLPPLHGVCYPSPQNFTAYSITDSVLAWRFALKSVSARGGRRGRGGVSMGYYRYDLPPADIEVSEEVTDIMSIVRYSKYNAVALQTPDVVLARILVKNGLVVYSPSLSVKVYREGDPVGVYARGPTKGFTWCAKAQIPPVLSANSVSMPEVSTFPQNQGQYYGYEYIATYAQTHCAYLPSIKVAEGLCIKTNVVKLPIAVSLDALRARFSLGVYYRNWYPLTRVTFVSQDPYRDRFAYPWIYPKLVDVDVEDLFKGASENAIEVDAQQLEMSALFSIVTPIEKEAEVQRLTHDELVELFDQLVDNLDAQEVNAILVKMMDNTYVPEDEWVTLYTSTKQEELETWLRERLQELQEQDLIENVPDSAAPEDDPERENTTDEEEEQDLFSGASRVQVSTIQKEKKGQDIT